MPLNIDILQILLHMFNFVILAGGLTFLVYSPVKKFLDGRAKHFEEIQKQNADAAAENEALKLKYEQMISEANEQISTMRAEAERETARVSKAYLDDANEKAHNIIVNAEHDAEARREHILNVAQAEIRELVVSATQKLLTDTATPEQDSAMYDEFIRLADKAITDKRASK